MNEIIKVIQEVDLLVIAIVIGLIVSGILEGVKFYAKDGLTDQQIKTGTLILGWVGGMIAMYLAGGDFTTYSIVGLAGGIYAPSIYEFILKQFGFSKKPEVEEQNEEE